MPDNELVDQQRRHALASQYGQCHQITH